MTLLFAVFLAAIFWGGYWLGWSDAKAEARMDRLFARLEGGIKRVVSEQALRPASDGAEDTTGLQGRKP